MKRYERQDDLVGSMGQEKLKNANVLVIGAGGLGSPVLMALNAAGVGHIGIVDKDMIEESNLNRQLLYTEDEIGLLKAEAAKNRLSKMNSQTMIDVYPFMFDENNGPEIMRDYSVIVDCVDNYETRKLVSKLASIYNKTVIEGGVEGYFGFVQVIKPGITSCFNCFSVDSPKIYRQVFGAAASSVGNMMALECLKQVLDKWKGDYNYIAIDLMSYDFEPMMITPSEDCDCGKTNNMEETI